MDDAGKRIIYLYRDSSYSNIFGDMGRNLLSGEGQAESFQKLRHILTTFQSWAGLKILADLQTGRSRLEESYRSLDKLKGNREKKRGFLWGLVLSSAVFKVVPVRLLGQ